MTERQSELLEQILQSLTREEKRKLIDRLEKDYRKDHSEQAEIRMSAAQKRRLTQAFREIADLPLENPDEGFSGQDHDDVLYGPWIEDRPSGNA